MITIPSLLTLLQKLSNILVWVDKTMLINSILQNGRNRHGDIQQ